MEDIQYTSKEMEIPDQSRPSKLVKPERHLVYLSFGDFNCKLHTIGHETYKFIYNLTSSERIVDNFHSIGFAVGKF